MDLQELIKKARVNSLTKVALTSPNVANIIAAHIRAVAPDLVGIPNIWFSGSNVWKHLYGETPDADADIDVFFLKACSKELGGYKDPCMYLRAELGLTSADAYWLNFKTCANKGSYARGCKFLHNGRKVDCWQGKDSIAATLNDYPKASHAHCRAAFSFTDGLVVLPNEASK